MGQIEEEYHGLQMGFLKNCWAKQFSKFISVVSQFKCNARDTHLLVTTL